MTEILTESFCERCGTRYTFESARPRVRLKRARVLSRGLKNFVLSDDNSIDEAMAAARSETDRELTTHQLDAFHATFNFCMSCRQYTCPNCWNEAEARCLTCAPDLGQEVMPAPFPDLVTSSYLVADAVEPVEPVGTNGSNGSNGTAHHAIVDDVPDPSVEQGGATVDVSDFATRLQALTSPTTFDEPAEAVPVEAVPVEAAAPVEAVPVEAAAPADVEVMSEIPYLIKPAAVAAVVEPLVEPVAAVVEPAVADTEPLVEPIAAVVEPVVADIEPLVEAVVAEDAADVAESDEESQIAARLAAFAAAATVVDIARGDEPAARPSIGEKGATQTGGLLRRFRAGQNLDAELDAYERQQADSPPVADEVVPEAATEAEAVVAAEPDAVVFEPEAVTAAVAAVVAEPEVEAIVEVAAVVVEPEVEAIVEAETVLAEPEVDAVPEAELEAVVVAEPEAEAVAEVAEPEAVIAAEAVVEPEPVAAETVPEAAEPEPVAADPAPPIDDVVPQPTWQMVAPDPVLETPAAPPSPPAPSIPAAATNANPNAEPQWPARVQVTPSVGLPFLGRPPAPQGGLEALWAESARDVVAPSTVPGRPAATTGIQPCISCGLSLSASARFCRRCGTPQAV